MSEQRGPTWPPFSDDLATHDGQSDHVAVATRRLRMPGTGLSAGDIDSIALELYSDVRTGWGSDVEGSTEVSDLPLAPGMRIGRYELIRELGRGGMGAVFLARDITLGRRVAIKFLLPGTGASLERFLIEARATARCTHENIVVIHEVDAHQGIPFMVLEYLRGRTLGTQLRGTPLAPGRAVELMVPVVRALACAHEQGIVHRDLKPDNIFLTDSGSIKVLDFGIAKVLAPDEALPAEKLAVHTVSGTHGDDQAFPDLTSAGALVGTLPFMSPEQWGAGTVDDRSDIWAVGIMLYIMVTGRHPLYPLNMARLSSVARLSLPMPRVREAAPDVPVALASIIDRCLIKPKDERLPGAAVLLDALEELLPGSRALANNECPYPGLGAFQEADANRFFGRARDISVVLARLRDRPLVAMVGASGVGKSSFVRAGIVPALKRSGVVWEFLAMRPGRQPLTALVRQLTPLLGTPPDASDTLAGQSDLVHRLQREPGCLGDLLRTRARRRGTSIILFVDQLEELYTLAEAGERETFVRCLLGAADDAGAPLRVMVSLRSDFLDRVAEDRAFMDELGRGLCFLPPPDRAGLEDALVRPAGMAGYRFESTDMIADMLDALAATPGALPLLQFTAGQLWDARDRTRGLLTRDSYERIGGVAGALAGHADTVLRSLPTGSRQLARTVFRRLVTAEHTRDIVALSELCSMAAETQDVEEVVRYFVDARLLLMQSGEDGVTVELVHESLIESWPTLRGWLEENQEAAAFVAELRAAARQWRTHGRSQGLLWRGDAVEDARRWVSQVRDDLAEVERAYLDAVFDLAARSVRVRRWLIAGTMAVLVALVAAAILALVWIRAAEQSARHEAVRARQAGQLAEERAQVIEERERLIREQLDQLEDQQRRANVAREEFLRVNDLAALTKEQLAEVLVEARDARETAEREERRARAEEKKAKRAAQHAREQAQEAEDARREAEDAKAKLQRTLGEKERLIEERNQRIRQLQEENGKLINTPLDP